MPLKILWLAGRVNGTGLARETQATPGKPASTWPFQGKGFEPSGTQHSCFGNCAELCLKVIKGHLDFCCVGVSSKRSICADAERDRITAIVACLWCGVARGDAEPSGFLV